MVFANGTMPGPQFRRGSLHRTERSATAQPCAVALKSIELLNSGDCVPVLVAITDVTEW